MEVMTASENEIEVVPNEDSLPKAEIEIAEPNLPATDRDAETGRVFFTPSTKQYKSMSGVEKHQAGIKNIKDLKN